MTVREALNTILDKSYDMKINRIFYGIDDLDYIPEVVLNMKLVSVKPTIIKGDPVYYIKAE